MGRSGTEGNHRKTGIPFFEERLKGPCMRVSSLGPGQPGPMAKASNQQQNHCPKAQH